MSKYNETTTAQELASDYAEIIKGKTILTTGVTTNSIGYHFIEAVAAASPALLILAGRNLTKLQQAADAVAAKHPGTQTRNLVVELGSLESVRKAAAEVNSWSDVPKIDVVVNCAGVMATPFSLTPDGFEMQFATNHIGHFLLTNLIMGKILASESPRVVNVSSDGHRMSGIRWADPHFSNGETYNKWISYGQSKTANMLFSISLAEKLGKRGLHSYSLHPGVIMTSGLGNHLEEDFVTDLKQADRMLGNKEGWLTGFKVVPGDVGAATQTFAAFDPSIAENNGANLVECRISDPYVDTLKPWATSPIEADKLWKLTEEMVGQKFDY